VALQHGQQVAQGEDLDILSQVRAGAQPHLAHEHREHPMDHLQRHQQIMLGRVRCRTGRSTGCVQRFGHHWVTSQLTRSGVC
jgi:hypothetical protein